MVENIPFPNPPIVEAMFDIRVTLPSESNLEVLLKFHDLIKNTFPTKKDRHALSGGFQFKVGTIPEVKSFADKVDGFLFHSADGKKIVQARLDGFTFNRLKPYSNWEDFSGEAKFLWSKYIEIAKPRNVTRLALRYINRIELPLPFSNFKEYILTIPEIGPNIPNELFSLFAKLTIPNEKINAMAIVTEAMENQERNILPFVFDIDVFRNINLAPTDPRIESIMNELREFKNQIFLNSITSKAKEFFK
jgi:uncharacterized protein (TIGR04255 family)